MKRKRKKINSSLKGGNFERTICKRISHWWSRGEHDDLFWRTAGSGARATSRTKQGKRTIGQYGDVGASSADGAALLSFFTISLKSGYNKHSLQDWFDKPKGPNQLAEFVSEVRTQADDAYSMHWLLIWKRDRRNAIAWMPRIASTQIKLESIARIDLVLPDSKEHIRGHLLSDFFKHASINRIKWLATYSNKAT